MMERNPFYRTCLAAAVSLSGVAVYAADEPAPPPHSIPATVAASAGVNSKSPGIPAGAAAVVDGHEIPMEDLIAICLRTGGQSVLDNMVNDYLVTRECERRNLVVSQAAIDERVERLRKRIAPMTLEEGLQAHQQTLPMLQAEFKKILQREMLVQDQIKPTKMANCRAIFVAYTPPGMPVAPGAKARSRTDALALAKKIQGEIKTGKDFGALATQHSEDGARADGGKVGVIFDGINDIDTALLRAALSQAPGTISREPIPTVNGYYLVQVISTAETRSAAEDALYKSAESAYKEQQAQHLVGPLLAALRNKSKVTYNLPTK